VSFLNSSPIRPTIGGGIHNVPGLGGKFSLKFENQFSPCIHNLFDAKTLFEDSFPSGTATRTLIVSYDIKNGNSLEFEYNGRWTQPIFVQRTFGRGKDTMMREDLI